MSSEIRRLSGSKWLNNPGKKTRILANSDARKKARRSAAEARQAARDARGDKAQLAMLEAGIGREGGGAKKEIARLRARLAEKEPAPQVEVQATEATSAKPKKGKKTAV